MPKVIKYFLKTALLVFVALALNLLALPQPTYAATDCNVFETDPALPWNTGMTKINSIKIGGGLDSSDPNKTYYLFVDRTNPIRLGEAKADNQGVITVSPSLSQDTLKEVLKGGTHKMSIARSTGADKNYFCSRNYDVIASQQLQCGIEPYPKKDSSYGPGETVGVEGIFKIFDLSGTEIPYADKDVKVWLFNNQGQEKTITGTKTNADGYFKTDSIKIPEVSKDNKGWWTVRAGVNDQKLCHNSTIYVSQTSGEPPVGTPPGGGGPGLSGKNPCEGGVCKTALGDIPTNPTAFAQRVLEIAIGLGGGLALILMVIGAIKVLTSTGDQQKLNAGRDMIVAAVAGLLFIIFSVLILRFIGFNVIFGF